MTRRRVILVVAAILFLWTGLFFVARVWDARHPPKYILMPLHNLVEDRYFSRGLDGRRVTVCGYIYDRSFGNVYLVESSSAKYPMKGGALKLQVSSNLVLPPRSSPRAVVSGVLHIERQDPASDYVLQVEQGEYVHQSVTQEVGNWSVTLLLITALSGVVALAYRSERHRWRRRLKLPGVCVRCGYDLRASSERCPECGTAIAPTESQHLSR